MDKKIRILIELGKILSQWIDLGSLLQKFPVIYLHVWSQRLIQDITIVTSLFYTFISVVCEQHS
jgi:hypothetical protein